MNSKRPNTSIIAYNCIFRNLSKKNPLWRPATEKVYFYEEVVDDNGGVKGEWNLEDTYTLTYDQQGRRIMELCENAFDGFSKTNYTYDANGMLSTELTEVSEDCQKFENSTKTERSYDDRLTSVITNNRQWIWIDNDWNMAGNCYQRIITCDDAGNIYIRRQGAKTDKVLVK